jgi:hypothetical protein
MTLQPELTVLDERTAWKAKIVAMTVRNAMEDFHVVHLTDVQMKELNQIIRNAIATALYALERVDQDPRCESFVNFQASLLPSYWEAPKLTDDLLTMQGTLARERKECARCGQVIVEQASGWTHPTEAGTFRGCRAASFHADTGWNDELDRRWKAKPPK